jgi:DGQHR domain-containing protein
VALTAQQAESVLDGHVIDIGPCILGPCLNMAVIRGFAPVHLLAIPSGPDIFDQESNKAGTQRDLNPKHARESSSYAMEALGVGSASDPRMFPEVILNVRDTTVLEIFDIEHPDEPLSFTSFSEGDSEGYPSLVNVRIHLDRIELPRPSMNPQISRVDGNHRLSGFDALVERIAADDEDLDIDMLPSVSFALAVGLEKLQEAKLFRDINGEAKKMVTDHLLMIQIRSEGAESLKSSTDLKTRALWIADELTHEGGAFHGLVYKGGAKAGVKAVHGGTPPLRFNTLRRTVHLLLSNAQKTTHILTGSAGTEALRNLVNQFWLAVSDVFTDAWHDKRNYMLMQTVGLDGVATFGGPLLDEAIENEQGPSRELFVELLQPIANFDMSKSSHEGLSGAAGTKEFVRRLHASVDKEAALAGKLTAHLLGENG